MSRPDVSIVVATYNRPALLANTLRSCLAQTNRLGLSLELVVIDNHPSLNGEPVVAELAATAPFPMRYVAEGTRNMSTLRNRGFSEATGRFVAFIDDDEVADPDWLDELVSAARDRDAEIAVGPRLAIFEAGHPPAYDPQGAQFARDLHLPDHALVDLTAASGKPRYGLGTGNSLFDMERCFPNGEAPMRLAFGDAGGEDAELFVRLHREGRRIVWAAKAQVTEIVPVHRTEVAYRLIRTRRETQHYVSIYIDGARHKRLAWAILTAKGILQLAAGAVIATALFEFGSTTRARGRLTMAHGLGKLSWKNPVGYIQEPNNPA
ncbi:glycosyltransferase family 2 protein [Phenylobacterium aquaticum]|uniref:glycosyltransferase family 2 protein n=1 Tax=Phenylobacterium aquaticum TaxID=1763816 RepID=UPI0026EDFB0F|nr:glycosyltransferase family 2 protein [Phenylobacterium aquaticum]